MSENVNVSINMTTDLRLIWGAASIGKEIGKTERQTFHLLESGRLPAKKVGGKWVADRSTLHNFFKLEIAHA